MRLFVFASTLGLLLLGGVPATGRSSSFPGSPAAAPSGLTSPEGIAKPKSDLTFFLTADNATFTSADELVLSGTAMSVPYVGAGKRVKFLLTSAFANGSLSSPFVSADGSWLGEPQALLYGGNAAGNLSSILLSIQGVAYDSQTRLLTLNITLVSPEAGSVKLSDGPVSAAISDFKQGTGPRLLTGINAETWKAVSLVVDSTRTALRQPAETKFFGWGWGGGWGGPWGGWGGGWRPGYYWG